MIGRFGHGNSARPAKSGAIGALDVGSTKVSCFIVKPTGLREGGGPGLKVLGIGHQVSRGVRAGTVVDINTAEDSIRAAVEQAERMAGVTLRDAVVGISCGQPQSRTVNENQSRTGIFFFPTCRQLNLQTWHQ